MKKFVSLFITVLLVVALLAPAAISAPATVFADVPTVPEGATKANLIAGQNIIVGCVYVWNDTDNLYVKYEITEEGWCLDETHLAVATSLEGIPQADGGNPPPGQFPYMHEDLSCVTSDFYTIPLDTLEAGCETNLYIAAHAVVKKCKTESFTFEPELTWTRSSEESVAVYPDYGAKWTKEQGFAIVLDPNEEVWDGGTVSQNFMGYSTRSDIGWASWVCTQNSNGRSTSGTDLRRFQATFDIPAGYTVTSGMLGSVNPGYEDVIPINDNIYIFVNEELLFWGGTIKVVDPGTTHFLGMERQDTQPQDKPTFPETDGWHVDGTFPAIPSGLFVEGLNELNVFAEEFCVGGGMHKLGLTLQVEQTTCETETAWGAGEDFPGANWATYFNYAVQCEFEKPKIINTYIGYEDWGNGDFDYNDFGMYFSAVEYYWGTSSHMDLTKVVMTFEAAVYDSGMDHLIHIKRPIVGDSTVTVTRGVLSYGGETPAGTYPFTGNVDVVLFDTAKYPKPSKQIGEIVTVEIVVLDPSLNPEVIPTAPRWDLDQMSMAFMANYDPWEWGTLYTSLFHIGDMQFVTSTTGSDARLIGLTLPYILVVPSVAWIPPYESTTITVPYNYFYDYYHSNGGSHTTWYTEITNPGGLSW